MTKKAPDYRFSLDLADATARPLGDRVLIEPYAPPPVDGKIIPASPQGRGYPMTARVHAVGGEVRDLQAGDSVLVAAQNVQTFLMRDHNGDEIWLGTVPRAGVVMVLDAPLVPWEQPPESSGLILPEGGIHA